MGFFELSAPVHMLDKARRELDRLERVLDIDNVLNFFVTAYHIKDYVESSGRIPKPALEKLFEDPDMRFCQALCNKGKHLVLTRSADPSTRIRSSLVGAGYVGEMMIGGGEDWLVQLDGESREVRTLARSVLSKRQRFLDQHDL